MGSSALRGPQRPIAQEAARDRDTTVRLQGEGSHRQHEESLHIRARIWLHADELVLRMPDRDWRLWIALSDGRRLALKVSGPGASEDALLPLVLAAVGDDQRGLQHELAIATGMRVQVLYAAPLLPRLHGEHAGGLLRADLLAYLQGIDCEVAELLCWLEGPAQEPAGHFCSVRNYNRLATLPEPQRRHRLQALRRFPALVAPILLTAHAAPNLSGGKRHARREADAEVELAIDAGRDLIGALAAHYDIGRALVRSPLQASYWPAADLKRRAVLKILDALPANKRPADLEAYSAHCALLDPYIQLLARNGTAETMPELPASVHAGAFRAGWTATFQAIEDHHEDPHYAILDSRDFLTAAGCRAAQLVRSEHAISNQRLACAWLAVHDLPSLLAASERWHAQSRSLARDATVLAAVLGDWRRHGHDARELLTQAALVAEGEAMKHCVADYWRECRNGSRIFAIRADNGERATACYVPLQQEQGPCYRLTDLRGPCNRGCSASMAAFADRLRVEINHPQRAPARAAVLSQTAALAGQPEPADEDAEALLDPRSEAQLRRALSWLGLLPQADERLLCAHIAGYAYHQGQSLEARLKAGQQLDLVREAGNPHDELAVRLDWQGHTLGYIPRSDNTAIAAALDRGQPLSARITAINPGAAAWQRVEFVVDWAGG